MIDIDAARDFVVHNARILDRRRLAHALDGAPASEVIAAVAAYRNSDGGYAGAIEPDARTLTSQPIGVLTAFDFLREVGGEADPEALHWLASVANPDGGLPFSLESVEDAPHAPWMRRSPGSSLHMTAAVTAAALHLGANHEWLDRAVAFCRERLEGAPELSAYETKYVLDLLDALGDDAAIDALGQRIPADGRLPVSGGVEGEALDALAVAPRADSRTRRLFDPAHVEAAQQRLAAGQREDGGWDIQWLDWSPSARREWRGRLTVDAVRLLSAA